MERRSNAVAFEGEGVGHCVHSPPLLELVVVVFSLAFILLSFFSMHLDRDHPSALAWLKFAALKKFPLSHELSHMVAEHPRDAAMVVAQRSSEEEQAGMEIDTAARRRCSEEERWYGAEKVTYGIENVHTTLGVLRGYYEADDRRHEAADEYQWDDRSGGDADKDVQGEVISKYSWSDGKKTVSIYIELDGLDDVAEDAFRAEAGETDVSITIVSVAGKQRTFRFTGLANEITGVEVAQRKGRQLIDEFVDKEMEQNAENLERDLAFSEKLADDEMMVPVDMRGVDEEFDDVEQVTAKIGAKGIAEAFIKAADFVVCCGRECEV